ncbi:protein kinase [Trypanosoma conorhini]|uniref:Protein kinase n=1 Tax=Trypanosoma conorhini TaxID=83891 RepID=A0A422P8Z5_9TRYP|nr:protein kinase [Trypanosoma conorhini]RNF14183.1 protein kinase [Trypanosoma conorhini]
MPRLSRLENPLMIGSSGTDCSNAAIVDFRARSSFASRLKVSLEETILPFGYNSLKELANIPRQDEVAGPTTRGIGAKSNESCMRCQFYEGLLRRMATQLLEDLEEGDSVSTSTAESSMLTNAGEPAMGIMELNPNPPQHVGSEGPSAGPKGGTAPRALTPIDESQFELFPSVTSVTSTLLTNSSCSVQGGGGAWLQELTASYGPDREKNGGSPFYNGSALKRPSPRFFPGLMVPQRCPQRDDASQASGSPRGPRHGTIYVTRGASYSISTIQSREVQPCVKETAKTVIGRANHKKKINDYVVLRELGRGSTGEVVLVQHHETKDLFAMKIVTLGNKFDQRRVNAIRSEIAVLKAVAHPHLVRLHEVIGDKNHNTIFMILQYISRGSIAHALTPTTVVPIPEQQLRLYTSQIVSALKHLHSKGIFHRDIKPENILIDDNERIYLADFGVSAICTPDGVRGVEGTPAFMAPEVCLGKPEVVGELVDVWALGVTLYQLMYGFLPFRAHTYQEMTRRIVGSPLVFPDERPKRNSTDFGACGFSYLDAIHTFTAETPPDGGDATQTGRDQDSTEELAPCTVTSSSAFKELICGLLCKDPDCRWTLRRIDESAWLRPRREMSSLSEIVAPPLDRQAEVSSSTVASSPLPRMSGVSGQLTSLSNHLTSLSNQLTSVPITTSKKVVTIKVRPIPTPTLKGDSISKITSNSSSDNNANVGAKGITKVENVNNLTSTYHMEACEVCPAKAEKGWKRFFPVSWRKKRGLSSEGHS